jgi:pre-peptidase
MSSGSSINVVANKWGNSVSQDATILVYNLAYGYLKFLGIQPAYSTDSRWERISTIIESASIIPWTDTVNPDGHPYWSTMEATLNVIKENAIETPDVGGAFAEILNSADYYNKWLAIAELMSTMPDIKENILAAVNMLTPPGTTITPDSVNQFFTRIKLIELAVLSGPRLAPTIVDLFYAPTITSTRVYFRPEIVPDNALMYGETVQSAITSDSPTHTYSFSGEASTTIVVTLRSNDFDTTLTLKDDAGTELAFNNDAPGLGSNSEIEYTLSVSGSYQIEIASYHSDEFGAYTLELQLLGSTINVADSLEGRWIDNHF